jgi:hypothetical protein
MCRVTGSFAGLATDSLASGSTSVRGTREVAMRSMALLVVRGVVALIVVAPVLTVVAPASALGVTHNDPVGDQCGEGAQRVGCGIDLRSASETDVADGSVRLTVTYTDHDVCALLAGPTVEPAIEIWKDLDFNIVRMANIFKDEVANSWVLRNESPYMGLTSVGLAASRAVAGGVTTIAVTVPASGIEALTQLGGVGLLTWDVQSQCELQGGAAPDRIPDLDRLHFAFPQTAPLAAEATRAASFFVRSARVGSNASLRRRGGFSGTLSIQLDEGGTFTGALRAGTVMLAKARVTVRPRAAIRVRLVVTAGGRRYLSNHARAPVAAVLRAKFTTREGVPGVASRQLRIRP